MSSCSGVKHRCTTVALVNKVISTVSDTYVSYTIDTSSIFYFQFQNTKLQYLASQLSPAVLRVGGTQADYTYYRVGSETCSKLPQGRYKCLNMSIIDNLMEFAHKVQSKLVFGLSLGYPLYPTKSTQSWDSSNTNSLLEYMKSNNYNLYGFEVGNEVNNDVEPIFQATAFKTLKTLSRSIFGANAPWLFGPDPHSYITRKPESVFKWLEDFFKEACDTVDGFTYHSYVNQNATAILTANGLNEQYRESSRVSLAMEKYCPNKTVWAGEIAEHNKGGISGVTDRFLDSFWYLDALGTLARLGQKVFARQVFDKGSSTSSGGYPLVNFETPLSDYWVAVLFTRLMGTKVLDIASNYDGFRVYAHCSKTKGVTVAYVNVDTTSPQEVLIKVNGSIAPLGEPYFEYILTSTELTSKDVMLNGVKLALTSDGKLPALNGKSSFGSPLMIPGHSIGFIVYQNATLSACQ